MWEKRWKCSKGRGQHWEVVWPAISGQLSPCGLQFFVKHLVVVELEPELLVGKVLAWFVVVWYRLQALGFLLVAQAALVQLGPKFLLVGQAAHLLQDSLACEKAYLVCVCGRPRGLCCEISVCHAGSHSFSIVKSGNTCWTVLFKHTSVPALAGWRSLQRGSGGRVCLGRCLYAKANCRCGCGGAVTNWCGGWCRRVKRCEFCCDYYRQSKVVAGNICCHGCFLFCCESVTVGI